MQTPNSQKSKVAGDQIAYAKFFNIFDFFSVYIRSNILAIEINTKKINELYVWWLVVWKMQNLSYAW